VHKRRTLHGAPAASFRPFLTDRVAPARSLTITGS